MANPHLEPDDPQRWRKMTWTQLMSKASAQYQGPAFTNDQSRVRESK
jgi:hypothetical protein